MRARHVAISARTDCEQLPSAVGRCAIDQSVSKQRPRGGVHAAGTDAPQFVPRRWIVGDCRAGAGTDHFAPAGHADYLWRAESLVIVAVIGVVLDIAILLPDRLASFLIEGH